MNFKLANKNENILQRRQWYKTALDMDGLPIKEGDLLTRDNEKYNLPIGENYPTEPFYIVKKNEKGGYFAESIEPYEGEDKYFFLHDFRFKFCKNLSV